MLNFGKPTSTYRYYKKENCLSYYLTYLRIYFSYKLANLGDMVTFTSSNSWTKIVYFLAQK